MSYPDAAQLAVKARDLALEEICKLLQNPEDLTKLSSLRGEYEKSRNANKLQLTSLVQSRVEAARSSKELLERSQKAVSKLKSCFEQIDSLCEECASLVENHEKIQELAVAHHNVTKTLIEIDDIIDLPYNAGIAEEMLLDDSLLLEAFKALSSLEGTSSLVREAMAKNSRRNAEQENLKDYFDKVGLSAKMFEAKLWSHYKNFAALSATNPGILVACNQIVEMQEIIDAQVPEDRQKHFKQKALDAVEQSVLDNFEHLFELTAKIQKPETEDAEVDENVSEIISEATRLSQQLIDVYDSVEPCFPSHFKVFERIWKCYHRNFAVLIDKLGHTANRLDNKSILEIVRFMESYLDTLRSLGMEDGDINMPETSVLEGFEGEKSGLIVMMDLYIERDKKSTTTWYTNILDSDFASEPKVDKDDKLWTPGFVDFFRILNDGFSVVETETNGEMLYKLACSAVQMMRGFISTQMSMLQRDVPPDVLCAFANNNVRSYDMAIEYIEHYDEVVDETFVEKLETEEVYRGFLEVARTSVKKLVESVFNDPGMVGLVKKLYQAEWLTGATTSSLIATLQDYLEEFEGVLDESIYKRVVDAALHKTVGSFTSALLLKMPTITEAVIAQMQKDESSLSGFFGNLLSADKVGEQIQILSSHRQLACADSVEGFVFAYLSILETNPETLPTIVEKVCNARSDINRADANEINDQCRQLFNQKQQKRASDGETESTITSNLWNKFIGL